jgi:rhamnulokinase
MPRLPDVKCAGKFFTMPTHYLACDLGADSGRLLLGMLDNGKITLEELHRFPNGPVKASGTLHWNIDGLFNELKAGLKRPPRGLKNC